jgi:hypothetical protein
MVAASALSIDGALLALSPPALPLLHALSIVVAPAATPVAIRKFLREKDMAYLPRSEWMREVLLAGRR